MDQGRITSDARLRAALPTIETLLERGATVLVASHLGRPEEGASSATQRQFSLAPVATRMGELLGRSVPLLDNWVGGVKVVPGTVAMLENVRFNAGESANDPDLAAQMAGLCDVFVMDAFGTAHRAQASTEGVVRCAPTACAGPLLTAELSALSKALDQPAKPVVAIVGGAKVSTKLDVLRALSNICDTLIVGGGIANNFIAAAGYDVGLSLYEPDLLEVARQIAETVHVPLPVDVMTATEISQTTSAWLRPLPDIASQEMILDIGPETGRRLADVLTEAGTIIWNGPLGVFEVDQFGEGTRSAAEAIAKSTAFSLAGGGDTLAAIEKYGVSEGISYMSTGGGAFLEFVEGKTLPAVAALEARSSE